MSDITVRRSAFQGENRAWLQSQAGVGPGETPSVTLDLALFTGATHYPNGFIPSGIVLGKTSDGKYGPYDPAAADGRKQAAGHLFGSLTVAAPTGVVGGALVRTNATIDPARLPIASGTGALDDAARLALYGVTYTDKPTVIPAAAEGGQD